MSILRGFIITPSVAATPGLPRDADSLPVGTLWRNGVALTTVVTVTRAAVGRYLAAAPIDEADGWVDGDSAVLELTWTMEGVAGISQVVGQTTIQTAGAVPGDAMTLAAGAITADVLTTEVRDAIADAIMARDEDDTEAAIPTVPGERTLRQAVRRETNHVYQDGDDAVVTKKDGTTEAFRFTLTRDAAALPVVGNTPTA